MPRFLRCLISRRYYSMMLIAYYDIYADIAYRTLRYLIAVITLRRFIMHTLLSRPPHVTPLRLRHYACRYCRYRFMRRFFFRFDAVLRLFSFAA